MSCLLLSGGLDPGHRIEASLDSIIDQQLVAIVAVDPPSGSDIARGQIDYIALPPGYVLYEEGQRHGR